MDFMWTPGKGWESRELRGQDQPNTVVVSGKRMNASFFKRLQTCDLLRKGQTCQKEQQRDNGSPVQEAP